MAIAFDAVSVSAALNNSDTTRTWSHTVASGSDRVLLVGTRIRDADAQSHTYATAVTYNGVSLTKYTEYGLLSTGLGQYLGVQWWYLLAPAVGTANVVVTWGNGTPQQGGAVALSLSGVDQTTPIEASGTNDATGSLTASVSVTTTTANAWVVSNVYSGATSAVLGAGPTQRDQTAYGSDFGASGTTATTSTGSVTHTWTHDAAEAGDIIGLAISVREGVTSSTQTLRPNATVSNTNWTANTTTLHEDTADDVDATVMQASVTDADAILGFTDPSPSLSALTAVSLVIRWNGTPILS